MKTIAIIIALVALVWLTRLFMSLCCALGEISRHGPYGHRYLYDVYGYPKRRSMKGLMKNVG